MNSATLTAYAYLLELDNGTDNARDTYGIRYTGGTGEELKFLYTAEYATQSYDLGAASSDADYLFFEGGVTVNGITFKLSHETLGSDDGAYGFATPLATLHAHNGWADQFLGTPAQGLVDLKFSVSGKAGGGG